MITPETEETNHTIILTWLLRGVFNFHRVLFIILIEMGKNPGQNGLTE